MKSLNECKQEVARVNGWDDVSQFDDKTYIQYLEAAMSLFEQHVIALGLLPKETDFINEKKR